MTQVYECVFSKKVLVISFGEVFLFIELVEFLGSDVSDEVMVLLENGTFGAESRWGRRGAAVEADVRGGAFEVAAVSGRIGGGGSEGKRHLWISRFTSDSISSR